MTTTQQKGTAVGTAGGAGIGALIGSAIGGSQGAWIGALAGAAVGAGIGWGVSTSIESKQSMSRTDVEKETGKTTQKTLVIRDISFDPTVVKPGEVMMAIIKCRAMKPSNQSEKNISLYVKHVITTPDGKTISIDSGTITHEQGERIIKTGIPIAKEAQPGAYSIKSTVFFEDISKDTAITTFHVKN
jgi:uncharacterized protein YcfJ